ncbi:MAG TPA: hypothetical protein VF168_05770 [Trueperaceae bacterium]
MRRLAKYLLLLSSFTLQTAPAFAAPPGAVPAALAGDWYQGSGSSAHYYDPSTGAYEGEVPEVATFFREVGRDR